MFHMAKIRFICHLLNPQENKLSQTEPLSRAMFMPGENKEKTLTTLLVISVSYGWQMGLEPTTFRTTI